MFESEWYVCKVFYQIGDLPKFDTRWAVGEHAQMAELRLDHLGIDRAFQKRVEFV